MKTILVWVLLAYFDSGHGGGPAVVDNLATRAECERLGTRWRHESHGNYYFHTCTQVRKVVP